MDMPWTTIGYVKTAVHYGWIPLILFLGWRNSEPRPTLGMLLMIGE